MPPGEAHERHVLIRQLNSQAWIAMVWRQAKMSDTEAGFKALFSDQPVCGALFLCEGCPGIQARRHQRFIAWKRDHCSDTKRRDELSPAYRSVGRHLVILWLRKSGNHAS